MILTILVRGREHDAVERRDGWKNQDSRQACVPQPLSFAESDTRGDQDVVEDLEVGVSCMVVDPCRKWRVSGVLRTRDPAP